MVGPSETAYLTLWAEAAPKRATRVINLVDTYNNTDPVPNEKDKLFCENVVPREGDALPPMKGCAIILENNVEKCILNAHTQDLELSDEEIKDIKKKCYPIITLIQTRCFTHKY